MHLCNRAQVYAPSASCWLAVIFPVHLDFLCISLIHFPITSNSVHLSISPPWYSNSCSNHSLIFDLCSLSSGCTRRRTDPTLLMSWTLKNTARTWQNWQRVPGLRNLLASKKYKNLATGIFATLAAKIKKTTWKNSNACGSYDTYLSKWH